MDTEDAVVGFAGSALEGGAVGLRVEGAQRVAAVRKAYSVPIIGLIKRDMRDSPVRITPYLEDVDALAQAGADIVAVDATDRVRPMDVDALIARIHSRGCLAMADCATLAEAQAAMNWGADLVGSTMSGYTGGAIPAHPDFALVRAMRTLGIFVVAEGRLNTPELVGQAVHAGADAVVVGSAVTRPDVVTSWFALATREAYGA